MIKISFIHPSNGERHILDGDTVELTGEYKETDERKMHVKVRIWCGGECTAYRTKRKFFFFCREERWVYKKIFYYERWIPEDCFIFEEHFKCSKGI